MPCEPLRQRGKKAGARLRLRLQLSIQAIGKEVNSISTGRNTDNRNQLQPLVKVSRCSLMLQQRRPLPRLRPRAAHRAACSLTARALVWQV
eukprot:12308296-Karenia_brevis.AAC.1